MEGYDKEMLSQLGHEVASQIVDCFWYEGEVDVIEMPNGPWANPDEDETEIRVYPQGRSGPPVNIYVSKEVGEWLKKQERG